MLGEVTEKMWLLMLDNSRLLTPFPILKMGILLASPPQKLPQGHSLQREMCWDYLGDICDWTLWKALHRLFRFAGWVWRSPVLQHPRQATWVPVLIKPAICQSGVLWPFLPSPPFLCVWGQFVIPQNIEKEVDSSLIRLVWRLKIKVWL